MKMKDTTMMCDEDDWATLVDENSNSSMQSADFSELPLPELNWKKSCDLQLDYSRKGLNVVDPEILNMDSSPHYPNSPKKELQCNSLYFTISSPKRITTQLALSSCPTFSETESLHKPQLSFTPFLNANAREMVKYERFNVPPCLTAGNGGAAKYPNIKLSLSDYSNETQARFTTPGTNARGDVVILTKHRIQKRLRQIWIGKQTSGYLNYIRSVPKNTRSG